MASFDIEIKNMGENAVLIKWPDRIGEDILDDMLHFIPTMLRSEKESLNNYTPGYNSLLLNYTEGVDQENKKEYLKQLYLSTRVDEKIAFKTWHIPVCYDEEYGLDLSLFMDQGLSKEKVVELHTSRAFRVYMIGFLPGFLYLGGLPDQLHMDRKESPRSEVKKGSIAIGGMQTGIYPMSSPGGWQIIGRTPLTLFDIDQQRPTPIRQGDRIQFYSIDKKTFEVLSRP